MSVDDYGLIGGEPSFIDGFFKKSGGETEFRKEFMRFSNTEWQVNDDSKQRLLEIVGW